MMDHSMSVQTLMWARRAAKAAGWSLAALASKKTALAKGSGDVVRHSASGDEAGTLLALRAGGDPMEMDGDGNNALMWSAFRGSALALSAMLDLAAVGRADARFRDASGANALMRAASAGKVKCVAMLIPFSEPGAVDAAGRTALMSACVGGHAACVKLLCQFEDPSKPDSAGRTPLMAAAAMGRAECCEALCHVVDPRAVDKDGATAADIARKVGLGHVRCAELIDAVARIRDERDALSADLPERGAQAGKGSSRL